jgi:hypothetical protein
MSLLKELNDRGTGTLPGLIGLEILEVQEGRIQGRLRLREELLAPNGYLHAATVVALADTSSDAKRRWPTAVARLRCGTQSSRTPITASR